MSWIPSSMGNNGGGTSTGPKFFYGTSSTTGSTAAKVVTCTDFKAADLVAGTTIAIRFTNANTASTATLNINSTGAVGIVKRGGDESNYHYWAANNVVLFTHNGTNWDIAGAPYRTASTSYTGITTLSSSVTSTSTSAAATPSAVKKAAGTKLSGTLAAGSTELSITNSAITSTAMFDVYAENVLIPIQGIERTGTTLKLTFPAQSSAVNIRVLVRDY